MAAWRYEISLLVLKSITQACFPYLWNIFQDSTRNFVSLCSHVMSFIQWLIMKKKNKWCENLKNNQGVLLYGVSQDKRMNILGKKKQPKIFLQYDQTKL